MLTYRPIPSSAAISAHSHLQITLTLKHTHINVKPYRPPDIFRVLFTFQMCYYQWSKLC
ncbi:hypothetical protein EXN66_Car007492 [Channa argus]|uniref:Uncharacterized protein n=1 Tax=Channa argus TaxID=215402 RepID=A0A6G1PNM4_CHAAH|nr:hypothetical protein EXN66_Car007492 [Channa argus]